MTNSHKSQSEKLAAGGAGRLTKPSMLTNLGMVASSSDHSLSSAMAGKRKRPSAQDEQANATDVVEDRHVLLTRIRLRYNTERRSLRYLICIRRARPGATSS